MNLLRGNPPGKKESDTTIDCVSRVRKKLEDLHEIVRKRVDIKSSQIFSKPGIIKKPGKYNLMLNKRFDFIILVEKRGKLLCYKVVRKVHILLLGNLMMWFTVLGRTEAKIKFFTRIG